MSVGMSNGYGDSLQFAIGTWCDLLKAAEIAGWEPAGVTVAEYDDSTDEWFYPDNAEQIFEYAEGGANYKVGLDDAQNLSHALMHCLEHIGAAMATGEQLLDEWQVIVDLGLISSARDLAQFAQKGAFEFGL